MLRTKPILRFEQRLASRQSPSISAQFPSCSRRMTDLKFWCECISAPRPPFLPALAQRRSTFLPPAPRRHALRAWTGRCRGEASKSGPWGAAKPAKPGCAGGYTQLHACRMWDCSSFSLLFSSSPCHAYVRLSSRDPRRDSGQRQHGQFTRNATRKQPVLAWPTTLRHAFYPGKQPVIVETQHLCFADWRLE